MWLKKEIIAFWNDEEGVTVIEIVLILRRGNWISVDFQVTD